MRPIRAFHPNGVQIPECEGCHKDVKRITKYSKTGRWLCGTYVADLEKPPVPMPPATCTSDENKKGKGMGVGATHGRRSLA